MKLCIFLASILFVPLSAQAVTVALFDFDGSTDADQATEPNVTSSLSLGAAYDTRDGYSVEAPNGGTNSRFTRAQGVNQASGSTGVAFPQAIIDGNYVEVTIAASAGYTFSLDSFTLDAGWQGPSDGRFGVTSDINGHVYANRETILTEAAGDAGSIPNVLQSNVPPSWGRIANGDWSLGEGTTIDVSGAEFDGISSVTFRIYGFAINNTTPNDSNIFRLDNIQLDATVIPEPSAALLSLIGFVVLLRRRR